MEQRRGVGGEEFAVAAGVAETEVLGGVVGYQGLDLEAVLETRVERAVAAEGEAIAQLGGTDEDEREQRAAVPLVDEEVVEGLLVEEVGLVEQEDGMDALAGELLDVTRHGVEEIAGGGCEAEREAELAVEVAAAESGGVGVGQVVAGGGDAVAERAN